MTKNERSELIRRARLVVRETGYCAAQNESREPLIDELGSAAIHAYDMACNLLRYVDKDAAEFIGATYGPRFRFRDIPGSEIIQEVN